MSITFSCTCGKNLMAKEEYAGRRTRCPACGVVTTIPNSGAATATMAKPPPAKETIVGKSSDTRFNAPPAKNPPKSAGRPSSKAPPAISKKTEHELPEVLPAEEEEEDFEIIEDEPEFEVIEDEPAYEVIKEEEFEVVEDDEEERRPRKKDRSRKARRKRPRSE